MSAVVKVSSLTKRYHRSKVDSLAGVDLSFGAGASLALLGANGSGKTTLLNCIAGLLKPTSGDIAVLGETPRCGTSVMKSIGYLSAHDRMYEDLTVSENIRYRLCARGFHYKVASVMAQTAIEQHHLFELSPRFPSTLSSGQRQRCLIAATLAHDPAVVLLDEPTSALDMFAKQEVHDMLKLIPRLGRSMIIATHDLAELHLLCNDFVMLRNGEIHQYGETATFSPQVLDVRVTRIA